MRTSNKLNYLNETKELIKEALREKGVEVSDTDTFRSYANKVKGISGAEDLSVELAEQDAAITELEEIANSLPEAGSVSPEGTMLIQQNGVYDVRTIAEVDVQVETPVAPQPDPPVFGFGTFKENGTYLASDYNIDGWSSLTIDVPSSGGGDLIEINRQLVMMRDLQNNINKGAGFDNTLYTDQQLEYTQQLFDYINRGVIA